MLSQVKLGDYTLSGISLGGIYTTLSVGELGAIFDVGTSVRSFANARYLFLSHGHVDHSGALCSLLGIRTLIGIRTPLTIFLPEEIVDDMKVLLRVAEKMQAWHLPYRLVPMAPGQEYGLKGNTWVRSFRTHHRVPSLGYLFVKKVDKLKPEFRRLPGPELGRLRQSGADITDRVDRLELAYATDTLATVLESEPALCQCKNLIIECTFLDDRKSLESTHAGMHIHLDELIARADQLHNERIALTHFSQMYSPEQVRKLLAQRLPESLAQRMVPLVPARRWPG